MTREQVEQALDSGRLEIHMKTDRWWKCRRNGKTKLWKTMPDRFRIPIKYGFRFYGAIDEEDLMFWEREHYWRIVP